jgi:AsmA protein
MQEIDPIHAEDRKQAAAENDHDTVRPRPGKMMRRFRLASLAVLALLGLALLPPLINISRYQRRIATSIGGSLGRPVHLDSVSLSLLPLPGLEIQNLVVDEDPAFGAEPIIRANKVRATLRLSSLWRRQVEFSTISFTEPSVNLVHTADGKWNIESILLQASHIEAAPTDQRRPGPTPRFPYIEATGARLNFKQNNEKMPFSLIESEFALWAPDPNQWRVRMQARPARTDSSASDTGLIELEGTLGRGESLGRIPVNLEGQWHDAPLGETSRVLSGEDAGWRGNMSLSANIRGTLGESAVTSRLRLVGVRRADFVPQQPVSMEIECFTTAMSIFHSFQDLRCSWPPNASADTPTVALTGEIPDVRHLERSSIQFGTSGIPAATVLNWLRISNAGISEKISGAGTLTGSMNYEGGQAARWSGQLTLHDAFLKSAPAETDSLLQGDIAMRIVPSAAQSGTGISLQLSPTAVLLGGRDPAMLEGRFDDRGYTLHLYGMATKARMQELANAIAPLGQGLVDTADDSAAAPAVAAAPPAKIDRSTSAGWSEAHIWSDSTATGRK